MLTVTHVRDYDAWRSLAPEWNDLLDRCPRATPFQRPGWLLPWWTEFGSGELAVLAFRAQGRLVGLLPSFIHRWDGCRQVTLVGTGLTDYLDLTAEAPFARGCATAALEWLQATRDEWDVADWQDLPGDSPLIAARDHLRAEVGRGLTATAASLCAGASEQHASLPHGLRRTIRISTRRLEKQARLEFETIRSDPDAIALKALFRLHQQRWAGRGGPQSMLDSTSAQRFLVAATKALSARGTLRLYTMRFAGYIVALIYAILDRAHVYGYITGMDPDLAKFSPGSLLLNYAMADAIGEGARVWDFLRGEEEYKFQWGARQIPKFRLRLRAATLPPGPAAHVRHRESEPA